MEPPIAAAVVEDEDDEGEEEGGEVDGEEMTWGSADAGVVMMDVRRTMDVRPSEEAVEERTSVERMLVGREVEVTNKVRGSVFWGVWEGELVGVSVVGEGWLVGDGAEVVVGSSGGSSLSSLFGGSSGLLVDAGGASSEEGAGGAEPPTPPPPPPPPEPPEATAGVPSAAIDAVGLPCGSAKKRLSSFSLQQ